MKLPNAVDMLFYICERSPSAFDAIEEFSRLCSPEFVIQDGLVIVRGVHDAAKAARLVSEASPHAQLWATVILIAEILHAPSAEQGHAVAERLAHIWNLELERQLPGSRVLARVLKDEGEAAIAIVPREK